MKYRTAIISSLLGVAMLCASCVYQTAGLGTTTICTTTSCRTNLAWTHASYDANGFPIFGYAYGRPIYGYTAQGIAIFTIAALTKNCYVPHWKPAPWYRGSWRYPVHIHRVAAPPIFPPGHLPSIRPVGGLQAPIHRNPASVIGPPVPPPLATKPVITPPLHGHKTAAQPVPAPMPAAKLHSPAPAALATHIQPRPAAAPAMRPAPHIGAPHAAHRPFPAPRPAAPMRPAGGPRHGMGPHR